MKIVLIDNYDSFVFNLAQYLGHLGADPVVVRSEASLGQLEALEPDGLVVSPGPGRPEEAGCSVAAIRHFAGRIPVLGVCLGHQAIGVAFGAKVVRAEHVMHGKTSPVHHLGQGIFRGLPDPFEATRYHSLVVEEPSLPPDLEVTARTEDGVVMGIRHVSYPVEGVQFHPESALTYPGMALIENFLRTVTDQEMASR